MLVVLRHQSELSAKAILKQNWGVKGPSLGKTKARLQERDISVEACGQPEGSIRFRQSGFSMPRRARPSPANAAASVVRVSPTDAAS